MPDLAQFKTPGDACPGCGAELHRTTNVTNRDAPQKDDWTVCIECTAVLRYNEDLTVRSTTVEERSNAPRLLEETIRIIAMLKAGERE